VVDQYHMKSKIYSHHSSPLVASNSASLIALALENGQLRLVDLNSGSSTHTIKAHFGASCYCVQWSPLHENILASGRLLNFINIKSIFFKNN
jgi:WD40 repeat protein